ncbi:MAG: glucose-1-phosphate adenylyltransferase [Polyangia bacterium]|jgi:glucose-1-phosphate adenylyltransferase|nr:glucose-1-phosphate adenylyltransferase [Polyangia bacterium]
MPHETLSVILGGGRGTRLAPLTTLRSKPAVPLAGKYRLIDIPISNSINSGIFRIYVLTQYMSVSLNRHVGQAYRFDGFKQGFVEILAADQTSWTESWFKGTADAVRRHLNRFLGSGARRILILSGDQLYRMDFRQMIRRHEDSQASATVAVIPVTREQATAFGLLRIDEEGRIVEFVEKPSDPAVLDHFRTPPETLARLGFTSPDRAYLASMGIYLFAPKTLESALEDPKRVDFGRDVLPGLIGQCRVSAFLFDGYWEDIGTIGAFFEASLALARRDPPFRLYDPEAPIYTRARFLPGSKAHDCRLQDTIVCDGCILDNADLSDCVVGQRSVVGRGVTLRRVVLMGADFYESDAGLEENRGLGRPDIGVGEGSVIENAIIDKNARIGRGVQLLNRSGVREDDSCLCGCGCAIREGIIVVPRFGVVPDGTVL